MAIGQTIYLWRSHRKMTQAKLAQTSGVSRPNLSAIEQGARDITIGTLRRIAGALDVRPGSLVDDALPEEKPGQIWTREKLDRVACYLTGQNVKLSQIEMELAVLLKTIAKKKLGAKNTRLPRTSRNENIKWTLLKRQIGSQAIVNLLDRIEKLQ